MPARLQIKRGTTFAWPCKVNTSIVGWQVKSQVRHGDVLVADLTVEMVNAATGEYKLISGSTSDWPLTELECDIRYTTDEGQVISTETFLIEVEKQVTQG